MMFIRRTRWWLVVLFFLGAAAAQAHDSLQSSTNIWLQPGQIEVELILSRVPARALADNPPPVPVTEDNFESTYHALFQKSAPNLVEVTLDGKKIEPGSITIALYQETDLRFDYLFPYPPNGTLGFTPLFIKRMDEGYINTLSINQGNNVLGYGNQDSDHPTFELILGPAQNTPVPAPTAAMSKPPQAPPIHNSHLLIYLGAFFAIGLFAAWNWWRISQKSRRKT